MRLHPYHIPSFYKWSWIVRINLVEKIGHISQYILFFFLLAHMSRRLKLVFLIIFCPLKIFFSRTAGPISNKLGTKHPWVKEIQVCSNEGSHPFPREDNYEIAKMHWQNLKIFFSRTTGLILTKLGIKHPWVNRFQVCSNEGPQALPG